jgi:hypothetical protein
MLYFKKFNNFLVLGCGAIYYYDAELIIFFATCSLELPSTRWQLGNLLPMKPFTMPGSVLVNNKATRTVRLLIFSLFVH